jgi:hypothetical protein
MTDAVFNLAAKAIKSLGRSGIARSTISDAAPGSESPFGVGQWWMNRRDLNVRHDWSLLSGWVLLRLQTLRLPIGVVWKSIRRFAAPQFTDRPRGTPACQTSEVGTIVRSLPDKTIWQSRPCGRRTAVNRVNFHNHYSNPIP